MMRWYVPVKGGFACLCYFSCEAFEQEFLGDIERGVFWDVWASVFMEFRGVLLEDHRGEIHLLNHPYELWNLDFWGYLKERVEEKRREFEEKERRWAKEKESEELPF